MSQDQQQNTASSASTKTATHKTTRRYAIPSHFFVGQFNDAVNFCSSRSNDSCGICEPVSGGSDTAHSGMSWTTYVPTAIREWSKKESLGQKLARKHAADFTKREIKIEFKVVPQNPNEWIKNRIESDDGALDATRIHLSDVSEVLKECFGDLINGTEWSFGDQRALLDGGETSVTVAIPGDKTKQVYKVSVEGEWGPEKYTVGKNRI